MDRNFEYMFYGFAIAWAIVIIYIISIAARERRLRNELDRVKRMVEENTPCPDVLVQIAAVRSALNNVGQIILEDHLRNCMVRAVKDGDFKEAMKDLEISLDRFIR